MRAVAVMLVLVAVAGCGGRTPDTVPPVNQAPAQASPTPPGEGELPVQNGITGQMITLPDGTRFTATGPDQPDVANVRLEILGIGNNGGNPVAMAAGNHVESIVQEEVTLPVGKAYLAVVVRGQPAAAQSTERSTELWLIAVRKHPTRPDMGLAYAITGKITGDLQKAKAQFLELGKYWRLPAE